MKTFLIAASLFFSSGLLSNDSAPTYKFDIALTDSNANLVSNGVFIFEPLFDVEANMVPHQPPAVMNQIDKQFVPHVLVVNTGTDITFPNADNLFHHVYSFSPTKQFELKLYKEFTAEPLTFDAPGIVDIGCNIHDWMLGYIIVSDSPFFVKTEESGTASLKLPKGDYKLRFWHPEANGDDVFPDKTITVNDNTAVSWQINAVITSDDGFDSGFGDY